MIGQITPSLMIRTPISLKFNKIINFRRKLSQIKGNIITKTLKLMLKL